MRKRFLLARPILDIGGRGDERDMLTLNDCFQHFFICGSTGTGKTSSSGAALANALLSSKDLPANEKVGFVVYLYKASDVKDWERWAFQHGRQDDVIRIGAEHRHVFNILAAYGEDEPINAVNALMNIAGLSVSGERKQSEAYWEMEQRKRLDRLIRLNRICGKPLSIQTLYRLHLSAPSDYEQLTSEEFAKESFLWQMMGEANANVGQDDPDFKLVESYFFHEMPYLADRTASSIRSMTSSVLEPFVSSRILSNLFCGESKLTLEEVFSGKILLLDIPVQVHKQVGRIAQIMLGYALMEAVEKRNLATHGNPLIFWMDECQNFLTPFTNMFMSVSRSSRAGTVLMTQNISNIMATLGGGKSGEAKVNALLGLTNTKIMHANNDHITNEWAAKTIGKAFQQVSSVSVSDAQSSSASSSQQLHYLVEPRSFTTLRKGGEENQFLVDAYITGTGRVFSNQMNAIKTTFKQHFAI